MLGSSLLHQSRRCASAALLPFIQRLESSHRLQARRSTGISYLDTWMGHQKRRSPAPASAVHVPKNMDVPSGVNGSASVNVDSSASGANTIGAQATYQLYNLRAARNIDPRRLVETFLNSHPCGNNVSNRMPVVLDMSAFHPDGSPHYTPPADGTLAAFANAIRSSDNLSLVGVTNLPEVNGRLSSMAIEAESLNLPVLQSFVPELKYPSVNTNTTSQLSARKKRGGVAPLLRPRRPVASNKTEPESIHDSKDEINNVKLLSNITASAETSSAKVHKGSIRSGQLVTSDLPNQSLVIIGSINPGGEVWSEGDVFVFGKLRGRVLAGLRNVGDDNTDLTVGDNRTVTSSSSLEKSKRTPGNNSHEDHSRRRQSGKIFATSFDPELICIGDTFTTIDDVSKLGLDGVGPAVVTLDDETGELSFERFDL
jgi:septum formation inhibitor MinC